MKKQEFEEKADKVFQLFFETVMAKAANQQYSNWKLSDSPAFAPFENMDEARNLASFYKSLRYSGKTPRWNSHPDVREAILRHLEISEEQYLGIMGKKKFRTIDDP